MITSESVAELSSWGILEVNGIDAKKFLQGQLTQDLNKIEHHAEWACHLTAKGRVIANFILVTPYENCYWLLMPREVIEKMIACLTKYALFSKVTLRNRDDDLRLFAIWQNAPHITPWMQTWQDNQLQIQLADSVITLQICPKNQAPASNTSLNAWELALIQLGYPIVNATLSEVFTVHDLNLLNATSFTKGCYTGQEIVARMQYKAKLKHHLYCITLAQQLTPNTVFFDENAIEVGRLVNMAADQQQYLALVWLRDDIYQTATALWIAPDQIIPFQPYSMR